MSEASRVIALAESEEISVFMSEDILIEIFRVLQEEKRFQLLLDEKDMYQVNIIEKIEGMTNMVEIKERVNVVKEDPEDNKIIECAMSSKSSFLVTYDTNLLKIEEYKGIRIMHPTDFLKKF